jgi:hypothetical protein
MTMARRNHRGVHVAAVVLVAAAIALTVAWTAGVWNRTEANRGSGPPSAFGVVPNVKYLLLGAAEQRVSAARLAWTDDLSVGGADFSLPCHPAEVFSQSPAAGTKVPTGTTVKLIGGPGSLPRLNGSCATYVTDDISRFFTPNPPLMQWRHTVWMTPLRTPPEEESPIAYGTAVTRPQLRMFGPTNPTSITCRDGACWALGTVSGCEYPLFSANRGATWRIGGHWLTVPVADAGSFVSKISILTTGVVAAYGSGNFFYVTGNSGRTWFGTAELGNVVGAKYPVVVRGGDFFEVTTGSYFSSDTREYLASTFARSAPVTWTLIPAQR